MKVFITLELEGKEELVKEMSQEAYQRIMETVDMLRKEGIPVQYKETNLPRYRPSFRVLGDLDKIEQ